MMLIRPTWPSGLAAVGINESLPFVLMEPYQEQIDELHL